MALFSYRLFVGAIVVVGASEMVEEGFRLLSSEEVCCGFFFFFFFLSIPPPLEPLSLRPPPTAEV